MLLCLPEFSDDKIYLYDAIATINYAKHQFAIQMICLSGNGYPRTGIFYDHLLI
jgi:hypothetical protein